MPNVHHLILPGICRTGNKVHKAKLCDSLSLPIRKAVSESRKVIYFVSVNTITRVPLTAVLELTSRRLFVFNSSTSNDNISLPFARVVRAAVYWLNDKHVKNNVESSTGEIVISFLFSIV